MHQTGCITIITCCTLLCVRAWVRACVCVHVRARAHVCAWGCFATSHIEAPTGTLNYENHVLTWRTRQGLVTTITSPTGSPSRGGDVTVYVLDINQPSSPTPFFLFCSCVCFCLYGPFNCISFHKFSQQLFAFSICSSGLISALLVLSTIYLCMKVFPSPDIILRGWLGSKRQLASYYNYIILSLFTEQGL